MSSISKNQVIVDCWPNGHWCLACGTLTKGIGAHLRRRDHEDKIIAEDIGFGSDVHMVYRLRPCVKQITEGLKEAKTQVEKTSSDKEKKEELHKLQRDCRWMNENIQRGKIRIVGERVEVVV